MKLSIFNLYHKYLYISFNKKIFLNLNKKKKKNKILVEFFNYYPSIIVFSIFSNFLAKFFNAEIQFYIPRFINFKTYLKILLSKIFFLSNIRIYNSFGAKKLIIPKFYVSIDSKEIYKNILNKIKNKNDVLNIKIKDIPVGDLIYDEYLRHYNLSTIDIKDKIFCNYLKKSINLFLFWHKKINKDVKAIIISHSVYHLGIPARIAIYKDVKVYNIGMNYIYSLSKKRLLRLSGFEDYKKIFNKIEKKFKINPLSLTKKEIKEKFIGNLDITQIESTHNKPNSFGKKNSNNFFLENNTKKNVLVSSHCFTDAAHAYGKNIFTDFDEWINFLGEFSLKNKNYNWLIKIHPTQYDRNYLTMKKIIEKYPSFIILPKKTTHDEIIKLGIEVVLTVYGSVGYEYPFFKIPVINACKYGPHIAFDFNYHPKNKKKYLELLKNIPKLKKKFNLNSKRNINQALQYYFTRFVTNYEFIDDLNNLIKKLKDKYGTSYILYHFIKNFNQDDFKKRQIHFEKFVRSEKFRIYADNTGKTCKPILFY